MADTNVLPLYLRFSSLPLNFQGTPQELADAIADGLEILAAQQFALFQRGSSEPSSDNGPWMDTSSTIGMWKAFNYVTGHYEPMALDPLSLKYILSASAPDHNAYDIWFMLDGMGKAQAVEIYYSGAWHDIYEDKFAALTASIGGVSGGLSAYSTTVAMNAAIAAAIAGISTGGGGLGSANFRAEGNNHLIAGTGSNIQLGLESEIYDPDSVFASDTFVAPSDGYYSFSGYFHTEENSGSATSFSFIGYLSVNGAGGAPATNGETSNYNSTVLPFSACFSLNKGDRVFMMMQFAIGGGATFKIGGMLSGFQIKAK
jgi:hypothetical protein